jgi:DNA-binding transcriptional regulator YdaS (Cro superfamily)
MTPQEALLKAVRIVGSQAKLARALGNGLTQSNIYHWLKKAKVIPAEYCPDIERLANGAVMCEELNPNANWGFIRNTPPYRPNHTAQMQSEPTPDRIRHE